MQILLKMRENGVMLEGVTCMALITSVAAHGAWPLSEEILRCSFADSFLFQRLNNLSTPEDTEGVHLNDEALSLLRAVRKARETEAPGAAGAHCEA